MGRDFRAALARDIILADGAMGTLLVSRGASAEKAQSPLNVTDPETVREVHDDYVAAGARILTTNTWDANRVKLTSHEWADSLDRINREGGRLPPRGGTRARSRGSCPHPSDGSARWSSRTAPSS